jgi:NADH-quinone oxidoreductase subunit J
MNLLVPLLACTLAVAVSLLRNPMHALLALVGVFLSTVLFYIIVGAEFIGLVFLIVYVGAVAILFLFVIMLLNVKALTSTVQLVQFKTQKLAMFLGLGLLVRTAFVVLPNVEKVLVLNNRGYLGAPDQFIYYVNISTNDVNAFSSLYTTHVSLFILITLILLVALIGAIVLATTTLEEAEPVRPHDKLS